MNKKKSLSSVTKKLIMAITGGLLVFFLLFHGAMNVVSIISPDGYEMICEFLGANWYALVATVILAFMVVLHFVYAFVLSYQNWRARGKQRYAVVGRQNDVSWAAQNMLGIGVIVLCGIVLHLMNFWYDMQWAEIQGKTPASGMEKIRSIFSESYYSIIYLIWLAALWFHLSHGISSVMQSIGWNNNVWQRRIDIIGRILAALIVLMFVSVVVYYWLIY